MSQFKYDARDLRTCIADLVENGDIGDQSLTVQLTESVIEWAETYKSRMKDALDEVKDLIKDEDKLQDTIEELLDQRNEDQATIERQRQLILDLNDKRDLLDSERNAAVMTLAQTWNGPLGGRKILADFRALLETDEAFAVAYFEAGLRRVTKDATARLAEEGKIGDDSDMLDATEKALFDAAVRNTEKNNAAIEAQRAAIAKASEVGEVFTRITVDLSEINEAYEKCAELASRAHWFLQKKEDTDEFLMTIGFQSCAACHAPLGDPDQVEEIEDKAYCHDCYVERAGECENPSCYGYGCPDFCLSQVNPQDNCDYFTCPCHTGEEEEDEATDDCPDLCYDCGDELVAAGKLRLVPCDNCGTTDCLNATYEETHSCAGSNCPNEVHKLPDCSTENCRGMGCGCPDEDEDEGELDGADDLGDQFGAAGYCRCASCSCEYSDECAATNGECCSEKVQDSLD